MAGSSDEANQKQPFVFSTTLGEFLHWISFSYLCFAFLFSILEYFDFHLESNAFVLNMLFNVIAIQLLLVINSRILFGIAGVLTFVSVVFQLIVFIFYTVTAKDFCVGYSKALLIFTLLLILLLVIFVTTVQLFVAAALFKLCGSTEKPVDVESRKQTCSSSSSRSTN